MFKKLLAASISLFAFSFIFFFAKPLSAAGKPEIPEINGVYNDPDHPGIKVRVFVYQQKGTNNGKPAPTPSPIIQCVPTQDPDSSSVDGLTGWKLPSNWTYNLNPGSVPSSVGSANLAVIATNAFSQWSAPTGITFSPGSNTTVNRQAYDGVNTVAWGRTSGSALAVTYTRYNTSTGKVVDVDTIFNNKFPWVWSNQPLCAFPGAYDAQNILTHETGHWVGLDDEYTNSFIDNTMYGYGSKGEVKKDTLTSGDYSAAHSLYQ